jgi:hypothetical protein
MYNGPCVLLFFVKDGKNKPCSHKQMEYIFWSPRPYHVAVAARECSRPAWREVACCVLAVTALPDAGASWAASAASTNGDVQCSAGVSPVVEDCKDLHNAFKGALYALLSRSVSSRLTWSARLFSLLLFVAGGTKETDHLHLFPPRSGAQQRAICISYADAYVE